MISNVPRLFSTVNFLVVLAIQAKLHQLPTGKSRLIDIFKVHTVHVKIGALGAEVKAVFNRLTDSVRRVLLPIPNQSTT